MLMTTLLLAHAFATLYMTGLIWFVQLVHYPLMGQVGTDGYTDYQRQHEQRTGWAVGPMMLVELVTTIAVLLLMPEGVTPLLAWLGLGMLAGLWLSTGLMQIPCHKKLGQGFNPAVHRRLVNTNWLRTVLWTGRGIVALLMLA